MVLIDTGWRNDGGEPAAQLTASLQRFGTMKKTFTSSARRSDDLLPQILSLLWHLLSDKAHSQKKLLLHLLGYKTDGWQVPPNLTNHGLPEKKQRRWRPQHLSKKSSEIFQPKLPKLKLKKEKKKACYISFNAFELKLAITFILCPCTLLSQDHKTDFNQSSVLIMQRKM